MPSSTGPPLLAELPDDRVVGVVGLGHIGHAMAATLVRAGFSLVVTDLERRRADELVAAGARWAPDAPTLARDADVVITCLPGPPQTRAVMDGPGGLAAALRPGSTWIEATTTDVHEIQRIAQVVEARGCSVLEVPHSGGEAMAIRGELTMYVAGAAAALERERRVLDSLASTVVYFGPQLGGAMTAKLITNMIAFVNTAALAEGLMMGQRAGLRLEPLCEAINESFGGSYVSRYNTPNVLADAYPNDFPLALIVKDCGLILERAREIGAPVPVSEVVCERMVDAMQRYGRQEGDRALIRLLEDATGTRLNPA